MESPRSVGLEVAKRAYRTSREGVRLYQMSWYHAGEERRARQATLAQLRERQWTRVQRVIGFAATHVPFYRDRFRDAGIDPQTIRTPDDLRRVPPLTKDDLRRNFPDRLVRDGRVYRPHQLGRSSGSTGESVHFVRPDAMWRRSLYYAVLLRTGGLRNTPIFVLTTPTCTPNSCSLDYDDPDNRFTNALLRLRPVRHLAGMVGLPAWLPNILTAPDDYLARLARRMARHTDIVLIADPVYLGAFARWLRRTGTPAPHFRAIITSYELLTDSLRDLFDEVFRCPVRTQYGASEVTDIANECDHGRLHVRMDSVFLETIRDGAPAAPGALARVLITDLDNFNMPLIRYDIGDVARGASGDCPCGRRTEGLATIEGRLADTIRVGDELLTPLGVDAVFRGIRGLAAYQVVQEAPDDYRIALMRDGDLALDVDAVRRRAIERFGTGSTIDLTVVDEIAPRPSNKFQFLHGTLAPVTL
jgi:phenylacetate-CoA ligase